LTDGHGVLRLFGVRSLVEAIGMDFDRETMPGWMALPDPETLPDRPFAVDYVRSWRKL
jgi:hypothetical protein